MKTVRSHARGISQYDYFVGCLRPYALLVCVVGAVVFLLGYGSAAQAKAFELAAGVGTLEEGDDRLRPAAHVHLGFGDFYFGRAYYWGREFGPVSEQATMISVNRRWSVFKTEALRASLGIVGFSETIKITETVGEGENETKHNLGGVFGLQVVLMPPSQPLLLNINWDSHVFPAGLNGGLLLATGRKQMVSLSLGVQL